MPPRYYAAMVRTEDGQVMLQPSGPLDSWDAAVKSHASVRAMQSPQLPIDGAPKYQHRILFDLGSLPMDDARDLERVLLLDPTLHAVFELGRRYGLAESELARRE